MSFDNLILTIKKVEILTFSSSQILEFYVFSQTERYKLYQNGEFFDMEKDVLETNSLNNEDLSENEKRVKAKLSSELKLIPQLTKK